MGFKVKSSGHLRQLALSLREAPARIQRQAAAEIREKIAAAIDQQFVTKTDPYGAAWKPPKDGGPTMQRTGDLRRGFLVEVVPGGVGLSLRISNKEAYAAWLQKGTSRMEARRLVPGATLPPAWAAIFEAAYGRAIQSWYATTPMRS